VQVDRLDRKSKLQGVFILLLYHFQAMPVRTITTFRLAFKTQITVTHTALQRQDKAQVTITRLALQRLVQASV
jgi:hypothetical protein